MKKLISLVMVLSLVLCLATTALAEEPVAGSLENPIVVTDIADLATVDVDMGAVKWFLLPAEWSGKMLNFSAPMSNPAIYILHPMMGFEFAVAEGMMVASYALESYGDPILIGLGSSWGYQIMGGSCELTDPVPGSEAAPAELTDITNPVTVNCIEGTYGPEYFMSWTNNGEGGYLTLNGVTGNFEVVELNWSGYYADSTEPVSVGVLPGEAVTITVRGADLDAITLDLSFEPFKEGESEYTPFDVADQDKVYTFDVAVKENTEMFYKLSDVSGAILSIADPTASICFYGDCWGEEIDDGDDNVLSVKVDVWGENVVVGISNINGEAANYTVSVSEPEGFDENPIKIETLDKIAVEIPGGLVDYQYYFWTATETGKVTLNVTGAEWFGDALYMAATEWQELFDEAGEWIGSEPIAWADVNVKLTVFVNGNELIAGQDALVFDVNKDDKVIIKIQTLPVSEWDEYGYSAYVDVDAAMDPVGSMNNPIIVNDPSELAGIDVPAGQKVYIAISSMLNGQVLTIAGDENTAVYNRVNEVAGNNGLFVVALNSVPSNMIVVENKGDKDASYLAEIAYPAGSEQNPVNLNIMNGAVNGSTEAGSTTYYVVNGFYNGNYILIEGAGLTVTVNGIAVEASNGKFMVKLDGVPVNSIIVTNTGSAAADYKISITTDNPNTGDAGILVAMAAAIITLTGAVALVANKKEG